ncbi:homoserine kinase-like [Salvia miltiorrhiza]|uniref:homoserine kinase-like n=1 Tax=Salvia miltiorrhiza TaxID=226208 RepID=UPI0025AD94E9|nr:homoserine kinase-like [Salvia miltiorrhiza]
MGMQKSPAQTKTQPDASTPSSSKHQPQGQKSSSAGFSCSFGVCFPRSSAQVSGYHADNVAPSILGGFVLIRSYEPLELMQLKFPQEKSLYFVLVNPEFEAPTKKMRAALPPEVSISNHVWNCSQAGALVASVLQGDLIGLGKALSSDKIVEPRRAPLIPGMDAVKKAAIESGGARSQATTPKIEGATTN